MLDEQRASTVPPENANAGPDDGRLTYTLTEAAGRLGISRALAYEAAHRGELPVCRIGRRMLVPELRCFAYSGRTARRARSPPNASPARAPTRPGPDHFSEVPPCPQRASFALAAHGPALTSTAPA